MKYKYKIRNANGTYLNNGTGLQSWFTLEQARKDANLGCTFVYDIIKEQTLKNKYYENDGTKFIK